MNASHLRICRTIPEPSKLVGIDTPPFDKLLAGIDRGVQAHLGWNQRLLRCALLHEPPGDDVLLADAEVRCALGMWFTGERSVLDSFDPVLTREIAEVHGAMHHAVRVMCQHVLAGKTAATLDVDAYERDQLTLVARLGQLREKITAAAARHDPLTGLPLRHGLRYSFDLRKKDALRSGVVLHVAMIDIDHFKHVNDRFGHAVGDLALKHVAQHIRAAFRSSDAVFRYGGEEFLALMLNSDRGGPEIAIDRLFTALRSNPVRAGEHVVPLTVTVGLARVRDIEQMETAIERADKALLSGKTLGRDRMVMAHPL